MIGVGELLPEATVWIGRRERASLRRLTEDGPILLLLYLFDWSST